MATHLLKKRRRASSETRAPALRPETARTPLVAFAVATLAVLAAVIAAVGPASGESAEYIWPPATLPVERPDRGFYAPLPLLNRVPASLQVLVPCDLAPALLKARPVMVLSTARRAGTAGALRIALLDKKLRISVDGSELAQLPWPDSCPLRIGVADGELRIPGRTVGLETGTLENMPIVTGLFTGLDLRAGEPPRVVIRTREYATSWTARQLAAGALAVALIGVALILAAFPRRHRRGLFAYVRCTLRSAWGARDPTDAAVVCVLLVWWIIAPTIYDDGAHWVELRAFDDLGASAFYYVTWGLHYPLGEWIQWIRHWEAGFTSDLVFMRIPTTVALFVGWLLCRWCVHRVVPAPVNAGVRWTLASAFLVGATAWGMTLRLEPFVSVLVLASLAATISFVLAPRSLPLAVATLATVLATTAHPTGLVALAPMLVAIPAIARWIRPGGLPRKLEFVAILLAGLALGLVLFAIDADLGIRLSDARAVRATEFADQPWWREYTRYVNWDDVGGETAIRRLSLALILLPVFAWLTHRRVVPTGVLSVPAASVAGALVLLAFVPSKWQWHFGAISSMAAIAVAAEVARMLRDYQVRWSAVRPILVLEFVGVMAIWSWTAPGGWGSRFDLQQGSWSTVFNAYSLLAIVAISAIATVLSIRAGVGRGGLEASVGWVVAIVSLAVVGLTSAMLIRDAAATAWSPARQNVEALAGHRGCGLASQLHRESASLDLLADRKTPVFLDPWVALYFPCATIPRLEYGLITVPRLIVFRPFPWQPEEEPTVPWLLEQKYFTFAAVSDLYRLTNVARGPGGVEVLSVTRTVPGFVRVDADRVDVGRATTGVRFRARGDDVLSLSQSSRRQGFDASTV